MLISHEAAGSNTYPGKHVPDMDKFKILPRHLSKFHEGAKKPDYNIAETQHYYKIELAAPGLQREDLFVRINSRGHLSISALHTEKRNAEPEEYMKHAFNYDCFHRDITLPDNIDTDFLKSEYREGILCIWFLKTEKACQKKASMIAVY